MKLPGTWDQWLAIAYLVLIAIALALINPFGG